MFKLINNNVILDARTPPHVTKPYTHTNLSTSPHSHTYTNTIYKSKHTPHNTNTIYKSKHTPYNTIKTQFITKKSCDWYHYFIIMFKLLYTLYHIDKVEISLKIR